MGTRRSTARSRPLQISNDSGDVAARVTSGEVFDALREPEEGELEPVFSPLAQERFARGLETIYEGYLVHYGLPRRDAALDGDAALVLGDYFYAQGLARIASLGEAGAVFDLAELISLCAQVQADGRPGDGAAWAASATLLGEGRLAAAREALSRQGDPEPLEALARVAAGGDAVDRVLEAHARQMDR
jgi:hypothetical protein